MYQGCQAPRLSKGQSSALVAAVGAVRLPRERTGGVRGSQRAVHVTRPQKCPEMAPIGGTHRPFRGTAPERSRSKGKGMAEVRGRGHGCGMMMPGQPPTAPKEVAPSWLLAEVKGKLAQPASVGLSLAVVTLTSARLPATSPVALITQTRNSGESRFGGAGWGLGMM